MNRLDSVLTRIQAKHPGWTVGRTESGLAFEAISRPDDHTVHVIIGASLVELERRLDVADPQSRG